MIVSKGMGADMMHALQSEQSARRILMALNNTPESKAAITWAVGNLVREGDQVLLYHMVKTPTLIPTASKWNWAPSLLLSVPNF